MSQGPLAEVVPDGIVLADGRRVRADVILWATGFRASLALARVGADLRGRTVADRPR